MPIDSAEKRRSISGIVEPRLPGVTPNAVHDQEWRQESGWSYSGILAGAGIVVTPAPASAVGAVVNPSVVLGSLILAPSPASAVAAIVDPVVVLGSLLIASAAASAVAAVVGPTVVIGTPAAVPIAPIGALMPARERFVLPGRERFAVPRHVLG